MLYEQILTFKIFAGSIFLFLTSHTTALPQIEFSKWFSLSFLFFQIPDDENTFII